jgi:hypothetical protein
MRPLIVPMVVLLAGLGILGTIAAQEESDREIEIRKNVKLIQIAEKPGLTADLASQYRSFLPVFREVLKENTKDHGADNSLILRVEPGIKEIGSAKTKRVQARVTSFCKNSKKEFVGSLILYSYLTQGPVNKEETEQFLRKQILEPLECYTPTERIVVPLEAKEAPALPVAEPKEAAPGIPVQASLPSPPARKSEFSERSGSEAEIHRNVLLIEMAVSSDIPRDMADQYRSFLSIFKEVLKESTKDQSEEKRLFIRVAAGIREVGSEKTKRAQARVTSFCRGDRKEYVGNLLLYSYATSGPVNKEEAKLFLRKQILEPLECYAPTERVAAPPSK